MSWSTIPDIIDKLLGRYLPKREEALRNKIDKLEKERDDLLKGDRTAVNVKRLERVLHELHVAEEALANRC